MRVTAFVNRSNTLADSDEDNENLALRDEVVELRFPRQVSVERSVLVIRQNDIQRRRCVQQVVGCSLKREVDDFGDVWMGRKLLYNLNLLQSGLLVVLRVVRDSF